MPVHVRQIAWQRRAVRPRSSNDKAYFPAEQPASSQGSWFPSSDEDPFGSFHPECSSPQGAREDFCLTRVVDCAECPEPVGSARGILGHLEARVPGWEPSPRGFFEVPID